MCGLSPALRPAEKVTDEMSAAVTACLSDVFMPIAVWPARFLLKTIMALENEVETDCWGGGGFGVFSLQLQII